MVVPKAKRLKSGLWRCRVRVNGRDVLVSAQSERECVKKARLVKAQLQTEKRAEAGTVGALIDRYIAKYGPALSPATVRAYKSYRKTRFAGCMDALPDRVDWQAEINREQVAPKSVFNAWWLVKPALEDAGYPVPDVKLPQVPVAEIPFLQPEEIKPFMEALRGKPYELPVLMELHGLRYSEVRAMSWDKIKNGTITVSGAEVRSESGTVRKDTNKTKSSSRTIPLLIPRIEDLRGQKFKRTQKNLAEDIQRVCKAAGVTVVTNHGLRHTFASLCYHLNIPALQTMQWGGWSNLNTVMKIYTRLSASSQTAASDKMKDFFAP